MLVPSRHQSTLIPSPTTVHPHPFQSLRGPKGYLGNHSPPYGGGDGGGASCWVLVAAPLGVGGQLLAVACCYFPLFFHSTYPAPAIARSKMTIAI